MDEKMAWNEFARTGKIEDYIKYTQIRNQTRKLPGRRPIVEISEGPGVPEVRSVFPMEVRHAAQDPGVDHPGADDRGERPSGHGLDPR